jgi:hypothetical protein
MARPKKEMVPEVPESVESVSNGKFMVFDAKGDFVREYTVEASGEDACEMATIFAEELNGTVKIVN